jgi:hypothetical protein
MSPEPIRAGTVKAYLLAIGRNLYRANLRETRRHRALDDNGQCRPTTRRGRSV